MQNTKASKILRRPVFTVLCLLTMLSCGKIEHGGKRHRTIVDNYDKEEISGRIAALKSGSAAQVPLVLLQYSDIHGDAVNAARIVEFYSEFSSYIDDALCCGDNLVNDFSNDYSWWGKIKGSNQVLVTIGNHDTASYFEDVSYSWTDHAGEDSYKKFIAPSVSDWGVVQHSTETYYYKDYPKSGMRLIVLDCMSYDEAQERWFSEVVSDSREKGLSVVAVSHYPVSAFTPIECNYSTRPDLDAGVVKEYWSHRPKLSGAVAIIDEFIDKGGDFVCWLGGHLHKNSIGFIPKHHGQIVLLVESASSSPDINRQGDAMRVKGGKNQDSFNIVGFDRVEHVISILKIGADVDNIGRSRQFLSIDYHSREILESY